MKLKNIYSDTKRSSFQEVEIQNVWHPKIPRHAEADNYNFDKEINQSIETNLHLT